MTNPDRESAEQRSGYLSSPTSSPPSEAASDRSPLFAILLGGTIVLSAVGGWFLVSRSEPEPPVMEMLAPERFSEAISTLSPESQRLALRKYKQCAFPLGVLTAVASGNSAGGTVSFSTSKYTSPKFHITNKPQKIAIPSPLPETGGLDMFTIHGDATALALSLYPTAWIQPLKNGSATIKTIWPASPPCK